METLATKNFRFSDFELDGVRRLLLKDGEPVALNPKAFDLLFALVESRGEVLNKDALLENVWPGQFVEEGNLKVHIAALRKAFQEDKKEHRFIVTVPGRGYSFVAELEQAEDREIVVEHHRLSRIVVTEENGAADADPSDGVARPVRPPQRPARNLTFIAGLPVIILAAAALGYWFFLGRSTAPTPIESIAVMPFVTDSGSTDLEYLADGMTESLINSLSHLTHLSVKAKTTVSTYKDKNAQPQQIGADLNVQAVLIGRVIQRDDLFALYLSLVDTRTGNQIWGGTYDRKQADIVALQGEIARDVSNKLRTKLSVTEERDLEKKYTEVPEANLLYLKGRFFWNKRSPQDLKKSIDFFEQATRLDPNYALAFAGLADAYSLLSNYGGSLPHETKPKARTAALKALSLDDSLAQAHTALGGVLGDYDYDFAGEEREYKRAIELNPNLATAHHWYGELLTRTGRHEEAAIEFQKALDIDPLSLIINRSHAESHLYARRYNESLSHLEKLKELEPNFYPVYDSLAIVNQVKGNYDESVEAFAQVEELMLGQKQFADQMRQSYARGGWNEFLREMTGPRRPANLPVYIGATFHAALGDKDSAIAELNRSFERRESFVLSIKVDPRLDPLRDDERFIDLMRRIGL